MSKSSEAADAEGASSSSKDEIIRGLNEDLAREYKDMLGHCKMIMENDGGRITINPDKFDKLIIALRTAVDNDGVLDKESTSYMIYSMHLDSR
jgi:hypothetical protein